MGLTLLATGDITQGRVHLDRAIALYNPAEHRALAMRFGQDANQANLSLRSVALWFLGYPEAALADASNSLKEAREIGQAATLMNALFFATYTHLHCGNHATANALLDELVALADEKGTSFWKAGGTSVRGWLFAVTDRPFEAVQMIASGISAWRSTGSTFSMPIWLAHLASAHAHLGQFDHGWRYACEAMTAAETTRERWFEADIHRIAGEIALLSPEPDAAKAEACFERALAVARQQQAKSWELRAAMSLARLWRDQGNVSEARELLAPVYGWFTEGFDTRDLKEAKALLEELAA
jgi:predicted ATPase